jgi:hypothetical protein
MRKKDFRVNYTSEGHIDLRDLEARLNLPLMLVWVLDRIRGVDGFAREPDRQNLEDRTEIFVDLWRRSKKHVKFRLLLDQAIGFALQADLLRRNDWNRDLLRLASVVGGKDTQHMLFAVVHEVAEGRYYFSSEEIREAMDEAWLFAAACLDHLQPIEDWKKLFRRKRYMSCAFYGLRSDPEIGLYYLPEYAKKIRKPDEADSELRAHLHDICRRFPTFSVEAHLSRYARRIRRIDPKMPQKIDKFLAEIGRGPVFAKK